MRLREKQWTCTDCEDADCRNVGHVAVMSVVIPDRKAHFMFHSESGWSCLDCGKRTPLGNCVP